MPRQRLSAQPTATTTTTQTVTLSATAKQMLVARLKEHQDVAIQLKQLKGRSERIAGEVEAIFVKEKQGVALAEGTSMDGHKMKIVAGSTKKFDQLGFMKRHGLTQADFDEFTEEKPKKSYLKFTHPGETADGDE